MLLSETLASMQPKGTGWTAVIGEDWSQGRATFGGLVTALGNEAMRRLVPMDRKLRALQTTFVGPALAGHVRLEALILRTGKVVTIAESRLWSADQIAATFTGIYGADRVSSIAIAPAPAPPAAGVVDLPDSDRPLGIAPSFLQHFDIRWAEGTRPFTGTPLNKSKAYIRHRDPAALTESHIVALIDCIPSVILQMMTKVAPSSSMETLQFSATITLIHLMRWRIDSEVTRRRRIFERVGNRLRPQWAPAAFTRQLGGVRLDSSTSRASLRSSTDRGPRRPDADQLHRSICRRYGVLWAYYGRRMFVSAATGRDRAYRGAARRRSSCCETLRRIMIGTHPAEEGKHYC